jgi:hypothetical protein
MMMATMFQRPAPVPPMPAVARVLARYDRAQLAGFIEVAVGLLDVLDGDPDGEPGTWTEALAGRDDDAGLTDDHEQTGDEEDAAWAEFHTRGQHKLTTGGTEPFDAWGEDNELDDEPEDDDPGGAAIGEDDEADDGV